MFTEKTANGIACKSIVDYIQHLPLTLPLGEVYDLDVSESLEVLANFHTTLVTL